MLPRVFYRPVILIAALCVAFALLLPTRVWAQDPVIADTDPSALAAFNSELEPYGTWYSHPKYGVLWVPDAGVVGSDFKPYVTSGNWALTNDGDWTWVSDHPFGWVVFHYGRWVWTSDYGWAWIPGRQYSNAWVVWRVPSGDQAYLGWAPAPPTFVWFGGSAVVVRFNPITPYVFCRTDYVFARHMHRHIVTDPIFVGRIGASTVHYVPYGHAWGPPMATARIPRQYVPQARVAPDSRAVALARHRASPSLGTAPAPGARMGRHPAMPIPARGLATAPQVAPSSGRFAPTRSGAMPTHRSTSNLASPRAPVAVGREASGRTSAPTVGSGRAEWGRPAWTGPAASPQARSERAAATPSRTYSLPSRSYSAPSRSYSAPSRSYSAPTRSYSAPSRSYSAPSRSYSAPSRSYSAPSRSYSAPSRSYSAPSRSYSPSSGGGRMGGGHAASPRGRR